MMTEFIEHSRLYPLPEDWEERPEVTGNAFDPYDAEDHDDSIYVDELRNGDFKVQVHIADPWAYLNPEDPIVKQAILKERTDFGGTEEVDHMFDAAHAEFFSLNCKPGEYKASITFQFVMTPEGEILGNIRIHRTKVCSRFVPFDKQGKIGDSEEIDVNLLHRATNAIRKSMGKHAKEEINMRTLVVECNSLVNHWAKKKLRGNGYLPTNNTTKLHVSAPIRRSDDLYNLFLLHVMLEKDIENPHIDGLRKIFHEQASHIRHQVLMNKLSATPEDLTENELREMLKFLLKAHRQGFSNIDPSQIQQFVDICSKNPRFSKKPDAPKLLTLIQHYAPSHPMKEQILMQLCLNPRQSVQFLNQLESYNGEIPEARGLYTNNTQVSRYHIRALGQIMEWLYGPPTSRRILFIGNWHMMDRDATNLVGQNGLKVHVKQRRGQIHRYELCFTNREQTRVADMPSEEDFPKSYRVELGMEMLKERCMQDMGTLWPSAPNTLPFLALDESPIELVAESMP